MVAVTSYDYPLFIPTRVFLETVLDARCTCRKAHVHHGAYSQTYQRHIPPI